MHLVSKLFESIKIQCGAPGIIFLTLFGHKSIQDIKRAEIQVKTYYPSNKVKLKEIEGSISLLEDKKISYLSFITLSPLEDKIIEVLQNYGPQIGLTTKLNINLYIQILNKIGINLREYIEEIRKIQLIEIKKTPEEVPKKPPVQKPLPIPTPKTPEEKINNPTKLEPHIIKLLEEKKLIRTQQMIIDEIMPIATSQNVIKNAVSHLKEKKIISYSRKKPQGWSLVN